MPELHGLRRPDARPASAASTRGRACCCSGAGGLGRVRRRSCDYDDAECVPWLAAAREAADVGWPAPVRDRVPVNVTVPAVGPRAGRGSCWRAPRAAATAKVKVAEPGQALADDLARVEAVRDALGPERPGPGRRQRRAGTSTTAVDAMRPLDRRVRAGVRRAAVRALSRSWPRVRRRRRTCPIAADESIRRADDPLRVAPARGRRHRRAQGRSRSAGCGPACGSPSRSGCRSWSPSALETSVGIAAGVALAAALPELPYACGLAHRRAARATTWSPTRCVAGATAALPVRHGRDPTRRARCAAPPTARPARRWRGSARGRIAARLARIGAVNPSTALATRARRRARSAAACARRCSRPARARPRSRSRCTPPTPRAGCGCTSGSTSGRPASSRSGWPRRPGGRCRSSPRPARRPPTCIRRCSRRRTPASRCWCSPPTGRPSCAAYGANQTIDQIRLYGDERPPVPRGRRPRARVGQNAYWRSLVCRAVATATGHRGDPGRCTSTWRSASLSCPSADGRGVAGVPRWPGRTRPVDRCPRHAGAGSERDRAGRRRAAHRRRRRPLGGRGRCPHRRVLRLADRR